MIESIKGVEPLAGDADYKPERIYQLICEGACNDFLTRQLDTAAAHDRMHMHAVSDAIRTELRRLKHTPHVYTPQPVPFATYACAVCGHVRRWGSHI